MATEEQKETTDVNTETDSQSSDGSNGLDQHTDTQVVADGVKGSGSELSAETKRIQELAEDNARLTRLLEASISQGRSSASQEQSVARPKINLDRSTLTPTETVLLDELEKQGSDLLTYRNVLGGQHDALNKSEVLSNPTLAPLYKANEAEVERYKRQKAEQGIYVTQKEALASVLLDKGLFEKPQPVMNKQKARIPASPAPASGAQTIAQQQHNQSLKDKLKDAKF